MIKINKNIPLDKEFLVINRSASTTTYTVPSLGVRRSFAPGQQMMITYKELQALSFTPGGTKLMYNYLEIINLDAPKMINPDVDPEYYYEEEEIKKIMLHGSLDEFKDMLDFSPMGVIDLIKDMAISLPLNDVTKRDALQEMTGFNVTAAIENLKNEDGEVELPKEKTRRVKKGAAKAEEEPAPKKSRRRTKKEAVIPEKTLEE